MKFLRHALLTGFIAFFPVLAVSHQSTQSTSTQTSPAHTSKQTGTAAAPTPQEIADAKSKGLVWVNTSTRVYHKDGSFYGTTKHGKFMTEEDAQKAGYRAAKAGGSKKTSTTATSSK